MRAVLLYVLLFISLACSAQIVQTKEVQTTIEREIAHLKELYRIQGDAIKLALDLQAEEYERRLEILNGEAEQLRDMQATYLPRESFEAFQKQVIEDIEANKKEVIALNNWKSTIVGQIALFGIALTVVMFLLNYFKPFAKKDKQGL